MAGGEAPTLSQVGTSLWLSFSCACVQSCKLSTFAVVDGSEI